MAAIPAPNFLADNPYIFKIFLADLRSNFLRAFFKSVLYRGFKLGRGYKFTAAAVQAIYNTEIALQNKKY